MFVSLRTSIGILALVAVIATSASCTGRLVRQYEYEEDLFVSLDGSATLYVNASMPAFAALRGLEADTNPRAIVDRAYFRRAYSGEGVQVSRVTQSRRRGRRFVHLRLDVDDVRQLPRVAPLAWSAYQFGAEGDVVTFRQAVGAAAGKPVGDVGWRGDEIAGFRLHVPSRILEHNSPTAVERGNILVWEQTLRERQASAPLTIEVKMESTSILSRTLLLFAASGLAALLALAAIIFWTFRRGKTNA